MILIFTLDDNNGTQLLGKRQSKDRVVADKIAHHAGDKLYIKEKTVRFFSGITLPENTHFITNFEEAPHDAYIFAEEVVSDALMHAAEKIYVFRWNRNYPSMVQDRINLDGWVCNILEEFPGHSHEKITMEVYTHA